MAQMLRLTRTRHVEHYMTTRHRVPLLFPVTASARRREPWRSSPPPSAITTFIFFLLLVTFFLSSVSLSSATLSITTELPSSIIFQFWISVMLEILLIFNLIYRRLPEFGFVHAFCHTKPSRVRVSDLLDCLWLRTPDYQFPGTSAPFL
ncbi:hypothetical protein Dimus_025743 [Dionaea muscipula]